MVRFALLALVLGCTAPAADGAPAVYRARCAGCHGAHGDGHGEARNLRDPAWQARTTDDDVHDAIRRGGAARGKSAVMPANPQLTPAEIDAIVRWLRDPT